MQEQMTLAINRPIEGKQKLQFDKAIEAGFELTAPPETWHRGFRQPWWQFPGFDKRYAQNCLEMFPGANNGNDDVPFFRGVMPDEVSERFRIAKEIFGEEKIVIYSPRPEDFQKVKVPVDPVMIGLIEDPGQGKLFFEIARWDTT